MQRELTEYFPLAKVENFKVISDNTKGYSISREGAHASLFDPNLLFSKARLSIRSRDLSEPDFMVIALNQIIAVRGEAGEHSKAWWVHNIVLWTRKVTLSYYLDQRFSYVVITFQLNLRDVVKIKLKFCPWRYLATEKEMKRTTSKMEKAAAYKFVDRSTGWVCN